MERRRKAVTKARLVEAERLLAAIIESADVIGQGVEPDGYWHYPATYVLLTLHTASFNDLAIYSSELEDFEDTHDTEPDHLTGELEADLGRSERLQQPEELGTEDAEASLGATAMVDQRRWNEGAPRDHDQEDLELDRADDEPLADAEPSLGWTAQNGVGYTGGPLNDGEESDFGYARHANPQDQQIVAAARRRYARRTPR